MLADVALIPLDETVLIAAERAAPTGLGSLDAIHLATAVSLDSDLGLFLAYDVALLEAAGAAGLTKHAPS